MGDLLADIRFPIKPRLLDVWLTNRSKARSRLLPISDTLNKPELKSFAYLFQSITCIMSPIIHCVRHGQGVHNLSHANHHLPDPELTPLGEEQARSLCAKYPKLANVQLIVSSPLRRTLQTALLAFPSQLEGGLQVLALPEMQEASNLICDTGRDLLDVKADFEQLPVNFDVVETGWHVKVCDSSFLCVT